MSEEIMNLSVFDTLCIKKPTKLGNIIDKTVKPPFFIEADDVPPLLKARRLDEKIPSIPIPLRYKTNYTRGRLGEPAVGQINVRDMVIDDPYNYEMERKYEEVHDPSLSPYFNKPACIKRLKDLKIMNDDHEILCTLKDYNNFRRYLHRKNIPYIKDVINKEVKEKKEKRGFNQFLRNSKVAFHSAKKQDRVRAAKSEAEARRYRLSSMSPRCKMRLERMVIANVFHNTIVEMKREDLRKKGEAYKERMDEYFKESEQITRRYKIDYYKKSKILDREVARRIVDLKERKQAARLRYNDKRWIARREQQLELIKQNAFHLKQYKRYFETMSLRRKWGFNETVFEQNELEDLSEDEDLNITESKEKMHAELKYSDEFKRALNGGKFHIVQLPGNEYKASKALRKYIRQEETPMDRMLKKTVPRAVKEAVALTFRRAVFLYAFKEYYQNMLESVEEAEASALKIRAKPDLRRVLMDEYSKFGPRSNIPMSSIERSLCLDGEEGDKTFHKYPCLKCCKGEGVCCIPAKKYKPKRKLISGHYYFCPLCEPEPPHQKPKKKSQSKRKSKASLEIKESVVGVTNQASQLSKESIGSVDLRWEPIDKNPSTIVLTSMHDMNKSGSIKSSETSLLRPQVSQEFKQKPKEPVKKVTRRKSKITKVDTLERGESRSNLDLTKKSDKYTAKRRASHKLEENMVRFNLAESLDQLKSLRKTKKKKRGRGKKVTRTETTRRTRSRKTVRRSRSRKMKKAKKKSSSRSSIRPKKRTSRLLRSPNQDNLSIFSAPSIGVNRIKTAPPKKEAPNLLQSENTFESSYKSFKLKIIDDEENPNSFYSKRTLYDYDKLPMKGVMQYGPLLKSPVTPKKEKVEEKFDLPNVPLDDNLKEAINSEVKRKLVYPTFSSDQSQVELTDRLLTKMYSELEAMPTEEEYDENRTWYIPTGDSAHYATLNQNEIKFYCIDGDCNRCTQKGGSLTLNMPKHFPREYESANICIKKSKQKKANLDLLKEEGTQCSEEKRLKCKFNSPVTVKLLKASSEKIPATAEKKPGPVKFSSVIKESAAGGSKLPPVPKGQVKLKPILRKNDKERDSTKGHPKAKVTEPPIPNPKEPTKSKSKEIIDDSKISKQTLKDTSKQSQKSKSVSSAQSQPIKTKKKLRTKQSATKIDLKKKYSKDSMKTIDEKEMISKALDRTSINAKKLLGIQKKSSKKSSRKSSQKSLSPSQEKLKKVEVEKPKIKERIKKKPTQKKAETPLVEEELTLIKRAGKKSSLKAPEFGDEESGEEGAKKEAKYFFCPACDPDEDKKRRRIIPVATCSSSFITFQTRKEALPTNKERSKSKIIDSSNLPISTNILRLDKPKASVISTLDRKAKDRVPSIKPRQETSEDSSDDSSSTTTSSLSTSDSEQEVRHTCKCNREQCRRLYKKYGKCLGADRQFMIEKTYKDDELTDVTPSSKLSSSTERRDENRTRRQFRKGKSSKTSVESRKLLLQSDQKEDKIQVKITAKAENQVRESARTEDEKTKDTNMSRYQTDKGKTEESTEPGISANQAERHTSGKEIHFGPQVVQPASQEPVREVKGSLSYSAATGANVYEGKYGIKKVHRLADLTKSAASHPELDRIFVQKRKLFDCAHVVLQRVLAYALWKITKLEENDLVTLPIFLRNMQRPKMKAMEMVEGITKISMYYPVKYLTSKRLAPYVDILTRHILYTKKFDIFARPDRPVTADLTSTVNDLPIEDTIEKYFKDLRNQLLSRKFSYVSFNENDPMEFVEEEENGINKVVQQNMALNVPNLPGYYSTGHLPNRAKVEKTNEPKFPPLSDDPVKDKVGESTEGNQEDVKAPLTNPTIEPNNLVLNANQTPAEIAEILGQLQNNALHPKMIRAGKSSNNIRKYYSRSLIKKQKMKLIRSKSRRTMRSRPSSSKRQKSLKRKKKMIKKKQKANLPKQPKKTFSYSFGRLEDIYSDISLCDDELEERGSRLSDKKVEEPKELPMIMRREIITDDTITEQTKQAKLQPVIMKNSESSPTVVKNKKVTKQPSRDFITVDGREDVQTKKSDKSASEDKPKETKDKELINPRSASSDKISKYESQDVTTPQSLSECHCFKKVETSSSFCCCCSQRFKDFKKSYMRDYNEDSSSSSSSDSDSSSDSSDSEESSDEESEEKKGKKEKSRSREIVAQKPPPKPKKQKASSKSRKKPASSESQNKSLITKMGSKSVKPEETKAPVQPKKVELPIFTNDDIQQIPWESHIPGFDRERHMAILFKLIQAKLKQNIKLDSTECTCDVILPNALSRIDSNALLNVILDSKVKKKDSNEFEQVYKTRIENLRNINRTLDTLPSSKDRIEKLEKILYQNLRAEMELDEEQSSMVSQEMQKTSDTQLFSDPSQGKKLKEFSSVQDFNFCNCTHDCVLHQNLGQEYEKHLQNIRMTKEIKAPEKGLGSKYRKMFMDYKRKKMSEDKICFDERRKKKEVKEEPVVEEEPKEEPPPEPVPSTDPAAVTFGSNMEYSFTKTKKETKSRKSSKKRGKGKKKRGKSKKRKPRSRTRTRTVTRTTTTTRTTKRSRSKSRKTDKSQTLKRRKGKSAQRDKSKSGKSKSSKASSRKPAKKSRGKSKTRPKK